MAIEREEQHGKEQDHEAQHRKVGESPAPITVDTLDLTTYQHDDTTAGGVFHDQFIMQVNGAEANGSPVTVPGLDSAYGLYLTADITGHETFDANGQVINGGNVFDTLDVRLMLDPGHNDGAASSPLGGNIGFANGTADDIILASGSIVSGSVKFENGAGHADFVESMTPTPSGLAFLHGSLLPASTLEQLLTTPPTVKSSHANADGSLSSVINGGTATTALVPSQPLSLPGQNADGFMPALLQAEILTAFPGLPGDLTTARTAGAACLGAWGLTAAPERTWFISST